MQTINFIVSGLCVCITTNDEFVVAYFSSNIFLNHILPGYSFNQNKNSVALHIYVINYSRKPGVLWFGKSLIVRYHSIHQEIHHLAYLVLYGIQQVLQKNNRYCLHSASIVLDKIGYLIVGESGAGKTTAVLEAEKLVNSKIYSDDNTVITIRDGKGFLSFGNSVIFANQPYDSRFTFNVQLKKYILENPYVYYNEIPVRGIFFISPHCRDGLKSGYSQKLLRRLFDLTSLHITATGYFCDEEGFVYPSKDTQKIALKRLNDMKDFLKNITVIEILGSYGFIKTKIITLLEEDVNSNADISK